MTDIPDGPGRMTVLDRGIEDGIHWATCKAPMYGAVNGYAYVPEDHPWRGLGYDEDKLSEVNVHGGLTYGGERGWLGFDTLHSGDHWPEVPDHWDNSYAKHWTPAMVADECRSLAAQIAAAGRFRYARSQGGQRWHRSDCSTLPPFPKAWSWADGRTGKQITDSLQDQGLVTEVVPCKRCRPNEAGS